MATILGHTTSKGAGNYIGETKNQLRDGRNLYLMELDHIDSNTYFVLPNLTCRFNNIPLCHNGVDGLFSQVLGCTTIPINFSVMKENGTKAKNMVS